MGRFETRWLPALEDLRALCRTIWIDRVRKSRATNEIILDLDSSVSATHGE